MRCYQCSSLLEAYPSIEEQTAWRCAQCNETWTLEAHEALEVNLLNRITDLEVANTNLLQTISDLTDRVRILEQELGL